MIFLTSVGNLVHLQGRSAIELHRTVLASQSFHLMGSLVCIKSGVILKRFCTHDTRKFIFIRVTEFVPVQGSGIGIFSRAFVADKNLFVNISKFILGGGHPSGVGTRLTYSHLCDKSIKSNISTEKLSDPNRSDPE